ncbi:hypothetical protein DL96DRAFT_1743392 [Flagelloscypha sp. PMI_526]|nr:hypothetical protein DL96DRAFT_1743392 [Flagelloscypha sp. PMI_526]
MTARVAAYTKVESSPNENDIHLWLPPSLLDSMTAPISPEEQKRLVTVMTTLIEAETIIARFDFCVFAILVWDWEITLNMEIQYVWKSKWNLGKVLYFLTRYVVMADVFLGLFWLRLRKIPDKQSECPVPFMAQAAFTCVGIEIAEFILVLRTWALWGRNKWVLAILLILQFIVFAYDGFSIHFFVRSVTWGGLEFAEVPGCILVGASRTQLLSGSLISIAALEFIIFIFTLIPVLRKVGRSRLIDIIFRDAVIFSLAMTLVSTINVVIVYAIPSRYSVILVLFQRVMHSVATSRILLHMRQGTNLDTTTSSVSYPSTSIQFVNSVIHSNAGQTHTSANASTVSAIGMIDDMGRKVFNDDISMWFGEEECVEEQFPMVRVTTLGD